MYHNCIIHNIYKFSSYFVFFSFYDIYKYNLYLDCSVNVVVGRLIKSVHLTNYNKMVTFIALIVHKKFLFTYMI